MINQAEDTDGNVYSIWVQNQRMSCSIASMWMARNIVRQMTFAESEWELAQRFYRAAVQDALAPLGVDPHGPISLGEGAGGVGTMARRLSTEGFGADEIVRALRNDGMQVGVSHKGTGPLRLDKHKLSHARPALVGVRWNDGGGHIIVAARINSRAQVVFLNPAQGALSELPNNGNYTSPSGATGFIDLVLYLSAAPGT